MLKKIYRICDHRNGGTKIPQVNKRQCFLNFVQVFGNDDLTIVADNCRDDTIGFLSRFTSDIQRTNLGNSGSFLYAMDLALQFEDGQMIYLVEDDYLHLEGGPRYLLEGAQRADYVSLYDHADKYLERSPNPLVTGGGENTKVILTPSTHWKFTNSTTMTFATRTVTLKADQDVFRKHCVNAIPADYYLFRKLAEKGRTLITPIPGRSTHCDEYPSPLIFNCAFPSKDDSNPPLKRPAAEPQGSRKAMTTSQEVAG